MQDTDNKKSWLDQLEVTGPIKGIMDFVDELSRNYDRRLAAMHIDYQKDVEEILACYKNEKIEYQTILDEQKNTIDALQAELKALQQTHHTMSIEYKITQESLETTRRELTSLTQALKQEEELVTLAKERIRVANEQLKLELEARGVEPADPVSEQITTKDENEEENDPPVSKPRRIRFKRTREFFQQVVADRLSRPIMLRAKKEPLASDQSEDQDTFSY